MAKWRDEYGPAKGASGKKTRFDGLKWLLVVVSLVGTVIADFYSLIVWPIRAAVDVGVIAVLLVIASQTEKGQKAWGFIKGARMELRKVVWPTRTEAIQTTLLVVVMVLVTALILWGIDSFFMWTIAWITGQRG
ncbi:preprotein translocase subunit SecE [Coxiella-like endosymbiont]|uniref:preprotein translocase subunit SecE n=1 Tax=Coxiella-like endosymbiont TaxID=1592897 RepID=UPI00215B59F5|nr:preprotein translocase subunit SecE [Coxiella-like endosymbiont]UVE59785.1 preprotein translocase subunit SecE [Coxiella-like endosymbiont]